MRATLGDFQPVSGKKIHSWKNNDMKFFKYNNIVPWPNFNQPKLFSQGCCLSRNPWGERLTKCQINLPVKEFWSSVGGREFGCRRLTVGNLDVGVAKCLLRWPFSCSRAQSEAQETAAASFYRMRIKGWKQDPIPRFPNLYRTIYLVG
jgi:hypothetical protein